jgi:endonuclease/exonuclease/phosphatase family metal-dependent hydrolase
MDVSIGTFNLNNLFSRYNFEAEIGSISDAETKVDSEIEYKFGAEDVFRVRTYRGKLVKAKDSEDSKTIADRIKSMDVDILAVQEVEDLDTLSQFNRDYLEGMYDYCALVEGNDPRLIDVGILSRLPIGGMTSWKFCVHPSDPGTPIFGRDMIQIEILDPIRSEKLFTIFNNHLKSHYVDYREDQDEGELKNSLRRSRQAEMVAKIIKQETRPDSSYIVLGDMNDPPNSKDIKAFSEDAELNLINALTNPKETCAPKDDDPPPPASGSWTHRFKESGKPAKYELYDHIWLSPRLSDKLDGAWIDRRTKHGGDGSDHDPAWVKLKF